MTTGQDIDTIDWSSLRHAYGPATDVPGHLRAIRGRDKKKRAAAWSALWGSLFHQGTRYGASAAVIPLLAAYAADPKAPDRVEALKLLVHLAVGYPEGKLGSGASIASITEHARALRLANAEAADAEEACYAQGARCVPTFVELTRDPAPRVREHAAFACAWFPEHAGESVPALESALGDDDERVLASAALALGYVGRAEQRGAAGTLLVHSSALVRLAAAIAQVRGVETPPSAALAVLVEHARGRSEIVPDDFAWPRLDAFADDLALSLDPELWERRVADTIEMYRGSRNSELYLKDLVETVFPDLATAGPPPLPSPSQRRLLDAIVVVEFPEERFAFKPREPWHYVEMDTWRRAAIRLAELRLPRTPEGLAALGRGDPTWREKDDEHLERLFLRPGAGADRKPLLDEAADAFRFGASAEPWSLLAAAFGPPERVTSAPRDVTALDDAQKRALRTILGHRVPWQLRGDRIAERLASWKLPSSRGALRAFLGGDAAWASAPSEDRPAREDTEPELFREQLGELVAELRASNVYRACDLAGELLAFAFGPSYEPVSGGPLSEGQRAALRAVADTEVLWKLPDRVREGDFVALLKRYGAPHDRALLREMGSSD